jgi:peroxiredoxin (alkyl hydroperoxide reductase subunit C)
MSLVGKKAPVFSAPAVVNGSEIVRDFSLQQYIGEKEVIFFLYPKDFSFVCPTEILEYQKLLPEFQKRNVAVVGASTDSEESHLAWLTIPGTRGGIEGVTFPLVADSAKTISYNYGALGGDWNYDDGGQLIFEGDPMAHRATFLIDREGIIRYEYVSTFAVGRNIGDSLRIVDAWQYTVKHGALCPADWNQGQDAMEATRESLEEFLRGR